MISCISHHLAESNHKGHFSPLGWVKSCGLRFSTNYGKGPLVSHCCWNSYNSLIFAHTHSPGSTRQLQALANAGRSGERDAGIIASIVWDAKSVWSGDLHKHTREPAVLDFLTSAHTSLHFLWFCLHFSNLKKNVQKWPILLGLLLRDHFSFLIPFSSSKQPGFKIINIVTNPPKWQTALLWSQGLFLGLAGSAQSINLSDLKGPIPF